MRICSAPGKHWPESAFLQKLTKPLGAGHVETDDVLWLKETDQIDGGERLRHRPREDFPLCQPPRGCVLQPSNGGTSQPGCRSKNAHKSNGVATKMLKSAIEYQRSSRKMALRWSSREFLRMVCYKDAAPNGANNCACGGGEISGGGGANSISIKVMILRRLHSLDSQSGGGLPHYKTQARYDDWHLAVVGWWTDGPLKRRARG